VVSRRGAVDVPGRLDDVPAVQPDPPPHDLVIRSLSPPKDLPRLSDPLSPPFAQLRVRGLLGPPLRCLLCDVLADALPCPLVVVISSSQLV
jgi:hypothetical protein